MPFLQVHVAMQPDVEVSRKIAHAMTELTSQHLNKDKSLTAVTVTFVDPSHWWIGLQNLDRDGQSSFALDIKVTSGSNIKSEMARYIKAIFAVMTDLIGQLHAASYIVIHEVPAAAWGYAGETQEHRFIAGRIAATA
jgi:4-oxalocrotonate tautomerase